MIVSRGKLRGEARMAEAVHHAFRPGDVHAAGQITMARGERVVWTTPQTDLSCVGSDVGCVSSATEKIEERHPQPTAARPGTGASACLGPIGGAAGTGDIGDRDYGRRRARISVQLLERTSQQVCGALIVARRE
jgi:hypothetical protein